MQFSQGIGAALEAASALQGPPVRSGAVRHELMQSRHGGMLILILPFLSSFGHVSKAVYLLWLLREALLLISSQKLLQVGERKKKKSSKTPKVWCEEETHGFIDTRVLGDIHPEISKSQPCLGTAE